MLVAVHEIRIFQYFIMLFKWFRAAISFFNSLNIRPVALKLEDKKQYCIYFHNSVQNKEIYCEIW